MTSNPEMNAMSLASDAQAYVAGHAELVGSEGFVRRASSIDIFVSPPSLLPPALFHVPNGPPCALLDDPAVIEHLDAIGHPNS